MKYYVLEYTHDDMGVAVCAVPNASENKNSKDYFKREICYINFATEGVTLRQSYITLEMLQELTRHIPELHDQHKEYLKQKDEWNPDRNADV